MNHNTRTNHGKWSSPSVPHRGWICIDVEDLGEPLQICDMCEKATIRFAHIMKHAKFPEILSVGCICAEHMENDYKNPRIRERKAKQTTKRKLNWSKRNWKESKNGNPYINVDGYNIVIFESNCENQNWWKLRVVHRESETPIFGNYKYSSIEEAKVGAFDALEWVKAHQLKLKSIA